MNADVLSRWIMDNLETYRVFIYSESHAIDMEYNEIGLWWSPVPDKSGKTLMVFHSCFTLATWYNLHQPKPSWIKNSTGFLNKKMTSMESWNNNIG